MVLQAAGRSEQRTAHPRRGILAALVGHVTVRVGGDRDRGVAQQARDVEQAGALGIARLAAVWRNSWNL